jgi:hypothetical protein
MGCESTARSFTCAFPVWLCQVAIRSAENPKCVDPFRVVRRAVNGILGDNTIIADLALAVKSHLKKHRDFKSKEPIL